MNIVIFSPQRWSHLYVSKHHYALELAKNNSVWFISAPEKGIGSDHSVEKPVKGLNLSLLKYKLMMPEIVKFKLPALYKKMVMGKLNSLLKNVTGRPDVVIDFGCYQLFDSMDFLEASKKILFLVDDFNHIKPSKRGAEKAFSVSTNIVEKFGRHGIPVTFINHGIAEVFARKASERLQNSNYELSNAEKLKFGYSGNLFIRFMDIPVLQETVQNNPSVEFHFFGSMEFDANNQRHVSWNQFLRSAPNIKLHGHVTPAQLAEMYDDLDGFLLCYKPDYKDYHGENSHKVFEYLSTGKVMVSTYLSLYEGSTLINSSPKDKNEAFTDVFNNTVKSVAQYNSPMLQEQRIKLALDNTYAKQVKRIAAEFESNEN